MAAAAALPSSLACPLRRSSRLAHAHAHPHPLPIPRPIPRPRPRPPKPPRPAPRDADTEHDSSSSDPENELTPRALRALKRQRLALDPDGLPFDPRARSKRRRKENAPRPPRPPSQCPKRPLEVLSAPLVPRSSPPSDWQACLPALAHALTHTSLHSAATVRGASFKDPPGDSGPPSLQHVPADSADLSTSPEPLTPLTPLTPSPESSPSLPGHDRPLLPPSPPLAPLPPPVTLDSLSLAQSPDPTPTALASQDSFSPPPPSHPISLDPTLDTLIPFDAIHPPFDPDLSVPIPPAACHPSPSPQLQGLDLQDHFHSFPQQQLYVPPNPVFVRDREINIWKLACQERVDCLLRRYGIDYIKALVESQARSLSQAFSSPPSSGPSQSGSAPPSQTKFRLYTPASYTYSSTTWGSSPGSRKPSSHSDDENEDIDPAWPVDDPDWVDADVDMEDEDEDDYEDDDDEVAAEPDPAREGEATVEGLVIVDAPPKQAAVAIQVDSVLAKHDAMQVDDPAPPIKKMTSSPEPPIPPRSADNLLRTIIPPLTAPILPLLSSLHVPLLSEPPRAFMGRGTPPDRRRLNEWSESGRGFTNNGMGPPLYLSPVPQRHPSPDSGIVPMAVDPPPLSHHPAPPHPQHTHGEWTSFLYSMLEGDGVGVGVGAGVGNSSPASEPAWYELGLTSVPTVVPTAPLQLPMSQSHAPCPPVEQPVEEANNTSSTLRFALG